MSFSMMSLGLLLLTGAAQAQDDGVAPLSPADEAPEAPASVSDEAPAPSPSGVVSPTTPPTDSPEAVDTSANPPARPTVGLALSGGGALGMAHIGVLLAMEELHIPADAIAGTSIGGLVGGLYATGMTAQEIHDAVVTTRQTRDGEVEVFREEWLRAFEDAPDRRDLSMRRKADDQTLISGLTFGISDGKAAFPVGIMAGHRQNMLFEQLTLPVSSVDEFDQLPIPYRAIGTDVGTGEEVAIQSGELASAMRATMAVPGIFAPVILDGQQLVDGGVVDNLPIDDVREMGADVVIASWIDLPLSQGSFFNIGSSMMFAMMDQTSAAQLDGLTDDDAFIVLRAPKYEDNRANCLKDPEIIQGKWACAPTLIDWGYELAMEALSGRTELQLSEADYIAWREAHRRPVAVPPVVDFIRVQNSSPYADRVIHAAMKQHVGQPFDLDKLNRDIDTLYGLSAFEWVSWQLIEEGDQAGLLIQVREKTWGPDFFTVGVAVEGNLDGDTDFAVTFAHRRLPFNALGGELQTEGFIGTERGLRFGIYQPISPNMKLFVALDSAMEQNLRAPPVGSVSVSTDGSGEVSELDPSQPTNIDLRSTEANAGLYVGVTPFRSLELRAGYELWFNMTALTEDLDGYELLLPDPQLFGQLNFRLRHDNLDDAWFPRAGTLAQVEVDFDRRQLMGGTDDRIVAPHAFSALYGGAVSAGRHTLSTFGEYSSISTTIPQEAKQAWFEETGADPTQRPSTSAASLGYPLGGLFRMSGYETGVLEGEEVIFGRVGYRARVVSGRVPVYVGSTFEAGRWGEADDELIRDQKLFDDRFHIAGTAYLGISTPLGPLYVAYAANDDDDRGLIFYLGATI